MPELVELPVIVLVKDREELIELVEAPEGLIEALEELFEVPEALVVLPEELPDKLPLELPGPLLDIPTGVDELEDPAETLEEPPWGPLDEVKLLDEDEVVTPTGTLEDMSEVKVETAEAWLAPGAELADTVVGGLFG